MSHESGFRARLDLLFQITFPHAVRKLTVCITRCLVFWRLVDSITVRKSKIEE
jgi:hypothetical protein